MPIDDILRLISDMHFPGFFVTVDCMKTAKKMPEGVEAFLEKKYKSIQQGVTTRKFAFQDAEWRMIFTFFPTDRVVDEKYAMKNRMIKKQGIF